MNSRMDKYEFEEPEVMKRTDKNADLYLGNEVQDYNKIDLSSNVSILKTDSRKINVDQIREMLDKKYRENLPQRKSINIELETEEIPQLKIDTKEYDINEILAKAKQEEALDYQKERLKKVRDTNYDILDKLSLGEKNLLENNSLTTELAQQNPRAKEQELLDLINTVTQLEAKNSDLGTTDLLNLKNEEDIIDENLPLENSFYTGNLMVKNEDFDDFQDAIKSNSVLIKILISIFVVIAIAVIIFLLNRHFNWGLF